MTTPTQRRAGAAAPNLLDAVIGWVDPKRAQQRLLARAQIGALSGGYNGARSNKPQLSAWNPGSGSPTTDAVADLPTLRDRSRDEMRNSGVSAGAVNGAVSGIVGTGLSATPSIDYDALGLTAEQAAAWNNTTRRRFNLWANSVDCDVARAGDFYDLQALAQRSWLESGDVFVITPRLARNGKPARLALQLIEGDRCCNPGRKANSPSLIEGVAIDPTTQEAMAYHFAKRHPGDLWVGTNEWQETQARSSTGRRNVLHLFTPLRPGQVRGVPWIAPVLEPLKQLNRWTENELNAAVTSSVFSVFAKMDAQAFQEIFDAEGDATQLIKDRSNWSGELTGGKAINLLPGEELGSVSSSRPNPLFDPFWQAMVRQIGMALEVPFEVLVGHFQSSYSAARGALVLAGRMYKTRRDMLAKRLCQPVYELWLADEIAEGRIAAPGFFTDDLVRASWSRCLWTGDGLVALDPGKEVQAAERRVALGISTLQAESILHDGVDWETKHRQRALEAAARRVAGLDASTTPLADATPADPADPTGDDPATDVNPAAQRVAYAP